MWKCVRGTHGCEGVADTFLILDQDGEKVLEFSTNRDTVRNRDGLELMGIDHSLMVEELDKWRGLPPEEIGAVVEGEEAPAVVSWWFVDTREMGGERRIYLQAVAVDREGRRVPSLERLQDDLWSRPTAKPIMNHEERIRLLRDVIEPMLQRQLQHQGPAPETGGYSPKLNGWVEIA